jgi:signal peptidase II
MNNVRLKAYGAATAVFALDRLTKWIIETRVSFLDTYKVIPGFFDIVHSENRGVAFGIFNDTAAGGWRTPLLALFSLVAVAAVIVMLWNLRRIDRLSIWGLALILGGAAGNLFDRVVTGRVTDFLLFYIGQYQWPAFNVADSAIVAGCGLLLLELLRPKRQTAKVP